MNYALAGIIDFMLCLVLTLRLTISIIEVSDEKNLTLTRIMDLLVYFILVVWSVSLLVNVIQSAVVK